MSARPQQPSSVATTINLVDELLAAATRSDVSMPAIGTICLGRYLGVDEDGTPQLSCPGGNEGPVLAQSLVPLDTLMPDQTVAWTLPQGAGMPLIIGKIWTGASPPASASLPTLVEVDDGEELVLRASRRLTLRCGEAALTLTADGQVLTRGVYISSHASGVQRIRGAAVRIN